MELTRVSTSLYSNLYVEYMESRVLMGKLVGKQLDVMTSKWKLRLTWGSRIKNPFYLDHFGHKWYAIEFTDEEELEFALDNSPWYVRGQIFHMEMWNVHFKNTDFISNLRVWIRIPQVPVQYRDAEILDVITQLMGTFVRADETTLSGLNGLFVRVLLEVDLRLPLKRILVVNDDEECPLLLSYEKLFEICFYYRRKMSNKHSCPANFDSDGCLLVDKIYEDEPLGYPIDFPADLASRWGHHTEGGSDFGTAGERCMVSEKAIDNELKGKRVKEFTDLDMDENSHFIHCDILDKQTNSNFFCTFVYA
ncbi:hypothetical protein D8674_026186 [Pyrus ussuriensis x Pyrus communis]|uniref:DUF4283 domain-containing protein n=1 Tax=Pyrus ussuriensis x Pyrus communis TaxID=2448454 RepID=A0A5N5IAZ4_9ROSA|nr:hypothetical protein D8674_026186 [Pyrus ussuriensis x Pyrus communis]